MPNPNWSLGRIGKNSQKNQLFRPHFDEIRGIYCWDRKKLHFNTSVNAKLSTQPFNSPTKFQSVWPARKTFRYVYTEKAKVSRKAKEIELKFIKIAIKRELWDFSDFPFYWIDYSVEWSVSRFWRCWKRSKFLIFGKQKASMFFFE